MPITLDGTSGITTPGLTNTGTETVVNLTTTGNTIIGDATTDTLTVGVTGIVKDASGNVGIGTSSPLSKLDVVVGASLTRRFLVNFDDSVITVKSANNSSNPESLRITGDGIRFNTGISGSGNEGMRLDSSGNLLATGGFIPTNTSRLVVRGFSPGSYNNTFSVANSTVQIISNEMPAGQWYPTLNIAMIRQSLTTGANAFGGIGFSTIDDSNDAGMHDAGRIAIVNEQGSAVASGTAMAFYTQVGSSTQTNAAQERMRITSGGSVLIGKTSGSTYLNVSTAFDYLATTFTSGAGNFGYLALPQTPSVTLMLVNLTNQNNGNLNMAFLLLCNTRSTSHGGGNGVSVVSATQNSTGTGGEISTYAFALSGSGTSISLRATCTLVSGSAVIDFTARIIQI